jgi:hypothetical protein
MSRIWKVFEISVLVLCLAIALAMAATSSAQSNRSDGESDERQSTSESQRDSDESRSGDRTSRQETRDREEQQSTSEDRDWDEGRESRARTSSRGESRRAPDMYDRAGSNDSRSDEQGGLGVAVEDDEQGVRVIRVYSNTPAQEMGLRSGDRITQVDGRRVESARDFISRIREMEPGEEVELDIQRNDDERSLTGELESRSEALPQRDQQNYQDRRFEFSDGRSGGSYSSSQRDRSDDALNRLYALERQLDQLRRELQQLRSSLEQRGDREGRPDSGRGSTVIYYENQPRSGESRFSTRQSQYQRPWQQFDNRRGNQNSPTNVDRSPGGETGEDRLRPNPSQLNER